MRQSKKRNEGIELLRIVLMLMVIYLHLTGLNVETRLLFNTNYLSWKGVCLYAVTILCLPAVNVFVIISGYFGIQREAKYHKAAEYWLQGLFFNILLTTIYVCITKEFALFDTSVYLFGIVSGNRWWFLTAFILLTFCKPLLNTALNNMSLYSLKKCISVMLLVTVIYPDLIQGFNYIFEKNVSFYSIVENGFSWIWFICLYMIGAGLSRLKKPNRKKEFYLFGYFVCMALSMVVSYGFSGYLKSDRLNTYFMRYTSAFMTWGGVFLFEFFLRFDIKNICIEKIMCLSKYTFGVYLFHEHPYVRMWLEKNLYTKLPYMNSFRLFPVICISIVGIYISGTLVDMIRAKIFAALQVEKRISNIAEKTELMLKRMEECNHAE